jgi:hypothetical protein
MGCRALRYLSFCKRMLSWMRPVSVGGNWLVGRLAQHKQQRFAIWASHGFWLCVPQVGAVLAAQRPIRRSGEKSHRAVGLIRVGEAERLRANTMALGAIGIQRFAAGWPVAGRIAPP